MLNKLLGLFLACTKIGFLAFGGGNTAIPLLEAESVPRWLTHQEFAELVGMNFGLPGVSVLKLAGMIGLRAAGILGLLVAVIGLTAPGLVLTAGAYGLVRPYRDRPFVARALLALQFGAVALLASSTLNVWTTAAGSKVTPIAVLLTAGLFVSVHYFKVSPAWAIVAAVIVGGFLL